MVPIFNGGVRVSNGRSFSAGSKCVIVIFAFLSVFLLLYSEDRVSVFGTSLSNIWKMALILMLLASSLLSKTLRVLDSFLFPHLWFLV